MDEEEEEAQTTSEEQQSTIGCDITISCEDDDDVTKNLIPTVTELPTEHVLACDEKVLTPEERVNLVNLYSSLFLDYTRMILEVYSHSPALPVFSISLHFFPPIPNPYMNIKFHYYREEKYRN
eukprot:sb/3475891/